MIHCWLLDGTRVPKPGARAFLTEDLTVSLYSMSRTRLHVGEFTGSVGCNSNGVWWADVNERPDLNEKITVLQAAGRIIDRTQELRSRRRHGPPV